MSTAEDRAERLVQAGDRRCGARRAIVALPGARTHGPARLTSSTLSQHPKMEG
jgi:hypothetical protein